jgi:AcrR family transcriptional regulator
MQPPDTTPKTARPTEAGQRPPRLRQSEIVEIAARVFHEKGYESTSVQEVAEAVGILKGSLYYYIDSKEDLLFEIIRNVHESARKNIDRTRELGGDPLQQIRLFVTRHLTFNAEHLVGMGVFFRDFRSLSGGHRETILAYRDEYDRFLRSLISDARAAGVVCPDIDPKFAALALLGMTNWIYQWYKPDGPKGVSELAQTFADIAVAGIACDPKSHTPGHRGQLAALPLEWLATLSELD